MERLGSQFAAVFDGRQKVVDVFRNSGSAGLLVLVVSSWLIHSFEFCKPLVIPRPVTLRYGLC